MSIFNPGEKTEPKSKLSGSTPTTVTGCRSDRWLGQGCRIAAKLPLPEGIAQQHGGTAVRQTLVCCKQTTQKRLDAKRAEKNSPSPGCLWQDGLASTYCQLVIVAGGEGEVSSHVLKRMVCCAEFPRMASWNRSGRIGHPWYSLTGFRLTAADRETAAAAAESYPLR